MLKKGILSLSVASELEAPPKFRLGSLSFKLGGCTLPSPFDMELLHINSSDCLHTPACKPDCGSRWSSTRHSSLAPLDPVSLVPCFMPVTVLTTFSDQFPRCETASAQGVPRMDESCWSPKLPLIYITFLTSLQSPEIQQMYSLGMPVSQIRTKIRQEFERHRYVNSLPAVDVLLSQSQMEFQVGRHIKKRY